MFGGIAASGADRLVYATYDGNVATFDSESGAVVAQFTIYPSGPAQAHVSACAVDAEGAILLADTRHGRVRRFSPDGRQLRVYGGLPHPGLEIQDDPGVLAEPCALLPLKDQLIVGCGAAGMRHGVQSFTADGAYRASFAAPGEGWRRVQGLVRVGDAVWVAETEAGTIRCHERDGSYVGPVDLHPDLQRPFRLAADGYGAVLMVLAPETEEEQETFGVARIGADGTFAGWAVKPGEERGHVYCPFDVAVLPDGRFAVADLPLGRPPEVRLQLFAADGRLLRTLVEDSFDLSAVQRAWFESLLARTDDSAATLYEQARVHHYHAGATPEHLAEAGALYRAALRADPTDLLARLGLAALLHRSLEDAQGAEKEYRAAVEAGGAAGDLLARMAQCRHDQGDLDGAIKLLEAAIEAGSPPEDYHDCVEALGSYYLERAGETPDGML